MGNIDKMERMVHGNRLAFFTVLFAQILPAQAPQEKRPSVSGTVVSSSGEMLKKAQVTLRRTDVQGEAGYIASTDAAGVFRFTDVDPGRYGIFGRKAGYVSKQFRGSTFTLISGQELTGVVIKMLPQGVISGKVTDADGDPVYPAMVQVLTPRYFRGKRQYQAVMGTAVNDLGEFRLANLAPGPYLMSAMSQTRTPGLIRAGAPKGAPEENYTPTYYPGGTDAAQATPIVVTAGSNLRGMDIRLQKMRTYHVRGKVMDAVTNLPVRDAFLNLLPAEGGGFEGPPNGNAVRNAAGTFDIGGVPAGSYILMINSQNTATQQLVDVPGESVDDLIALVKPALQLSGSVTVDGNETVDFRSMRFLLEPVMGRNSGMVHIQPKPDGTFDQPNVSATKLRLQVLELPDNAYLKSVRMGTKELAGAVVDLSGGVAGPLEIVIGAKPGQISGTVKDARQELAPNVNVIAAPDSSRRDQLHLFKQIMTDQNGSFTLKGIAPGEYTVLCWENLEDGAWQDPAVLAKYESKGIKVKVEEGGVETAQVKMISAEDTQ